MNKISFILLTSIVLLITACSGSKHLLQRRSIDESDFSKITDTVKFDLESIETVYGRFTGTFSTEKKVESKGSIRIKKDSLIWISIKPFYIEAARCIFSPDSIFIVNKLEQSYFAGDYSLVEKYIGIPVDFYTIQSILLNSIWNYPIETDSTLLQSYKMRNKKNEIIGITETEQNGKKHSNQSITIAKDLLKLISIDVQDFEHDTKFTVLYSDFAQTDSILYPHIIEMNAAQKHNKFNIDIDFSKISFNIEQTYPFSINPKYTSWQ
ncbi:MAG: DUF4292 domain-containing protein [Bacteroidales bacterium]|jgi:hypothetical protein|nr:DUF4292 domain-containing protein [Bacteroidales bacterium]